MTTTNDREHERLMRYNKVALANTLQQVNRHNTKLTADLAASQARITDLVGKLALSEAVNKELGHKAHASEERVAELEETLKWIRLCLLDEDVPETNRIANAFDKARATLGKEENDDKS